MFIIVFLKVSSATLFAIKNVFGYCRTNMVYFDVTLTVGEEK